MRELLIAGRKIADDRQCYVIAELGHNHGGSLPTALRLIDMAAQCGASAIKLQKRDLTSLYTPAVLNQPYDHEHSFGKTYGEHRAALEFDGEQFDRCFGRAKARGLAGFATAFDEPSADFLIAHHVPALKVHSGGATDGALLKHVASLGVPVILSTGACTERDVDAAVQLVTKWTTRLALLHCTASYPLQPDEANLRAIVTLRERYPETVIGFSSHHPGLTLSLVAYALGARILEHHVTLSRASKGTDHGFSLEPKGLATLVEDLEKVRQALGDGQKRVYESERKPIAKMRRDWIKGMWQIGTDREATPAVRA
jgi:sialic acid synthase